MPTRGNTPIQVRLEAHQRTALQAVAEREGVSVSDVVRGALAGVDPALAIALGWSAPRDYSREQAEGYWGQVRGDRRRPAAAAAAPAPEAERRADPEGDRREAERREQERRAGQKQRRGGRRRGRRK